MEVRTLMCRVAADTSGFSAGTAKIKSDLTELNKDFYENIRAMKDVNDEIKKLDKQMKGFKSGDGPKTKEETAAFAEQETRLNSLILKKAQYKTIEQELKSELKVTTDELTKQNGAFLNVSAEAQRTYGDSIKSIDGTIEVLNSELEKTDVQYRNNEDSAEGLAKKTKILNDIFEQQENKSKKLKSALKLSMEEFGDGSNEVNKLKISLNKAESEMGKTENALKSMGNNIKKAKTIEQELKSELKVTTDELTKQNSAFLNVSAEVQRTYGDSIKSIDGTIKVLNSELEKTNVQYRNNEDSAEGLAKKTKILNDIFEQQENKSKKLKSALKLSMEEFGEGSDKVNELKVALNRAETEMGKTENALKSMGNNIKKAKTIEQELKSELKVTTGELTKQNGAFLNVSKSTSKAKSSLSGLTTMIKGVALGFGGKKLVDFLIGSNAEMEQYITSFEVMLGSAGKAKSLTEGLTEFANKTPLQLPDVTKNATMLLNYGLSADNVINKLRQLGDLSHGNAEKIDRITLAYGQMLAKGKVTGEELRQMTEAGVPLNTALAEAIGKSTAELAKMIESGKVGIPELDKAIANLTTGNGKFAGMLEKQSENLSGLISTMQDYFAEVGRDIGTNAFEQLKDAANELLVALNDAKKDGSYDEIVEDLGSAISGLVTILVNAGKFIYDFKEGILATAVAVGTFKAAMAVTSGITATVGAIKTLTTTTKAAEGAQIALNTAQKGNAIGLITSLAAGAIAGLIALAAATETTGESLKKAAEKMDEVKKSAEDMVLQNESELSIIVEMTKKYNQLRTEYEKTGSGKEALINIANELQKILPEEISLIDEESRSYRDVNAEISTYIANKRRMLEGDSKKSIAQEAQTQIERNKQEMDKIKKEMDGYGSLKDLNILSASDKERQRLVNRCIREIAALEQANSDLQPAVDSYINSLENMGNASGNLEGMAAAEQDFYGAGNEERKKAVESTEKYVDEISESFKREIELMKQKTAVGEMTEAEYYSSLETLLKNENADKLGAYNQYYSEIYNYQTSANEKVLSEQKSANSMSLSEVKKQASEIEKSQKELLENKKKADEEILAASKENFSKFIAQQKNNYDEEYQAQKDSIDNMYKLKIEAIDNQFAAYEKSINEQIKLSEEQDAAEKERLQSLIDGIDKEIEQRKRLKEEVDGQKEIDVVSAKLKYSQLDDFSRMELEKELGNLEDEKFEKDWQNQKSDEKDALSEQMSSVGGDTSKLKDQLAAAKELSEQSKKALSDEQEKIVEVLETQKTKMLENFTVLSENAELIVTENMNNINAKTAEMGENFARTVKSEVGASFDYCISRANEALAELRNSMALAGQLSTQIKQQVMSSGGGSRVTTTNSNNRAVTMNNYNNNLSADQIARKAAALLYD